MKVKLLGNCGYISDKPLEGRVVEAIEDAGDYQIDGDQLDSLFDDGRFYLFWGSSVEVVDDE